MLQSWTILQTTYEGTKVIKDTKLQRLTSSCEEIRMGKDETFDEFYAKLKDIVNSFNFGENIIEPKIVRKIIQSLLGRFHTKTTSTEESKDIEKISLTKLVWNLETYEMGLVKIGKGGKSKNMACKVRDDEEEEPSNDEQTNQTKGIYHEPVQKVHQEHKCAIERQ